MQKDFKGIVISCALAVGSLVIGIYSIDMYGERGPAMLMILIFLGVSFIWIRFLAHEDQTRFFFGLFLLAFMGRVFVSFMIHYMAVYGTFSEDEVGYNLMGWTIAQNWRGEFFGESISEVISAEYGIREAGYAYVVAFFYYIFGQAPLVPKMFNCFLGGMAVIYYSKFCWDIFGKKAGKLNGMLCAFFPSLILWSSLNLKDTIATFCVVYTIYTAYRIYKKFSVFLLLKLVVAFIILGQMRSYMFILIGACVGLGFFVQGTKKVVRNYLIGVLVIISVFFVYSYLGIGSNYAQQASFEQLHAYRRGLATGDSAIHMDADISSPGKALAFLPIGVVYFLFAPFPWVVRGFRQAVALPEVLVWYGLFYFFVKGLWNAYKKHFHELGPAISVLLLITITYSLVEGNLGTAYRHRAQIMGLYLFFTSVGLSLHYTKKNQTQSS